MRDSRKSSWWVSTEAAGRASRQLQLGFEREGLPAAIAQLDADGTTTLELPREDTGLVVVGGIDAGAAEVLRRARRALDEGQLDATLVFTGTGLTRAAAEAAGADEVVTAPAYLRDVVVIARMLRSTPASQRARVVGSLAETTGVYALVRALSALGRSAVLTLIRACAAARSGSSRVR